MKLQYIIMVALLLVVLAFTGCDNGASPDLNVTTITKAGSFDQATCEAKGLDGKAIMFESKYCGHCQETLPVFAQACDEAGIECEILDVSVPEQYEKMTSYGLEIQYTPTFIFDCEYVVGALDEETYVSFLESMK